MVVCKQNNEMHCIVRGDHDTYMTAAQESATLASMQF